MATVEKKRSMLTGFNFSEKECIWMRAKVVPTKYCDNAFDCTTCAFDKGMARNRFNIIAAQYTGLQQCLGR